MSKADETLGKRMADLGGKTRQATERDGFRPLGADHFDALTSEEQDQTFGPTVAGALRDGTIKLSDLVDKKGDFLVRKPIDELNL